MHDAPAASEAPQVFALTTNSAALPLDMLMLLAVAPPVLLTVTVCGALDDPAVTLPNESDAGDADRFGVAAAVPVPLIATWAGEPPV